jgi:hypothetical protein
MKRTLPLALFALLVVLVYADPLFTGRQFLGRDLLGYVLPMEKVVHDAWSRGHIPAWDPYVSGGRPLAPHPSAGVFYPVRIALSVLPFPASMRVFPVLHWILSGWGVIVLARSLGVSRGSAFVAAVTYVFSGVGVTEQVFMMDHPGMALLPWVLWAFQRPGGDGGSGVVLLGLFLGLDLLAGDVFTTGLGGVASACWMMTEAEPSHRRRLALRLAGGLGLSCLLAAPQIAATALWLPETERAVLGIKIAEAGLFAVSPWRLLELLVPFPFGPTWSLDETLVWGQRLFGDRPVGFFATLYAGALALVTIVEVWRRRSPGARFIRAYLLLCLVLSTSLALLPRSWGGATSPVALRYPEKFAVGIVFALSLSVALGLDALRGAGRAPRWPLAVALGCALLALGAAVLPQEIGRIAARAIGSPDRAALAGAEIPAALAEAGLLWVATAVALDALVRGRGGPQILGFAILVAVPVAEDRRIARVEGGDVAFGRPPLARYLDRVDPGSLWRVLGSDFSRSGLLERGDDLGISFSADTWVDHAPGLWNRGTVFQMDFDRGEFARLGSLRRIAAGVSRSGAAADFFGGLSLRWSIRFLDQPRIGGYRLLRRVGNTLWLEHEDPLPAVRLLGRWREVPGALEAAGAFGELGRGEVVLETGQSRPGTAGAGQVVMSEETPERLSLQTNAPDPAWLFVLRGYWNHREVRVDGLPVECVPAQVAFSAVPVPAGRHRVEWREEIPGLRITRWGPVLFALAAGWVLWRGRGRR